MIDSRDLCKALGVDYDHAKSDDFYLMLVKQYRFHYEAAQQNAHLTLGSRPVFCVCCGGEVSHPVCIDCLPSPAQVA